LNDNERNKEKTPKIYGWVLENENLKEHNQENIYCPLCGSQIKSCPNCETEFTEDL
jgi:hypothetical protein